MKKIIFITVCMIVMMAGSPQAYDMGGVDIHGFVSQGYLCSDDNNYLAGTEGGTTEYNEFGINFSTRVADKVSVGMQFFARDLGDYGEDDLVLDWAVINYGWRQWLGFRAGQLKIPRGFYNETRDIDASRVSILMPQSVYSETTRDTSSGLQGAGIYGTVPMGFMGNALYQMMAGRVDTSSENSGTAAALEAQGVTGIMDIDIDDLYAYSLIWETPLEGLRVGWSYMEFTFEVDASMTYNLNINSSMGMIIVPDGMGGWIGIPAGALQPDYFIHTLVDMDIEIDFVYDIHSLEMNMFSAEYIFGDLMLAYEYQESESIATIFDTNGELLLSEVGEPILEDYALETESYYVSGAYRFCSWFELGAYYSVAYYNKDDKDGELDRPDGSGEPWGAQAWLKDECVSARFDINEHWTLKLEHHSMDGLYTVNPDDDGNTDKNWHLYAAKMTLRF